MRYIINKKTGESHPVLPGVDIMNVISMMPKPKQWKIINNERTLIKIPSDTEIHDRHYIQDMIREEKKAGLLWAVPIKYRRRM